MKVISETQLYNPSQKCESGFRVPPDGGTSGLFIRQRFSANAGWRAVPPRRDEHFEPISNAAMGP